jgi:uncharacterized glyoxalase superfamily protein PhnB
MKFGYAILYVDDVEGTLEFYEQAFGLRRRMLDEELRGAGDGRNTACFCSKRLHSKPDFAANDFIRSLIPVVVAHAGLENSAPPVEFGMTTEDVDSSFQKALAAGAIEVKRPERKSWGQVVGYVRDLNGFLVAICSEMP